MNLSEDSAGEIRRGEEIDLNILNGYLQSLGSISKIHQIRQFPGGYSNLTYLLEGENTKYVLRKPPKGAAEIKGGHDMAREFNLLHKLYQSHFREIPRPLFLCNDINILGSPFYVMEKIDGIILRAKDARSLLKTTNSEFWRELSLTLCDKQASLHSINIETSRLIELGKPEGYVERQVNGWFNRYLNSQTDDIHDMNNTGAWLQKNIPESLNKSLLHNDYKYDNLILNKENPSEILSILDWEMATVGDPLMDLGSTLAYWVEAGDEDFNKAFNLSWLPGNISRVEYAQRYQEKTQFNLDHLVFYYVFGLFKNSVIIQQIYSRYKKGLTTDARFAGLLEGVKILSKKAILSLEKDLML